MASLIHLCFFYDFMIFCEMVYNSVHFELMQFYVVMVVTYNYMKLRDA